MLADVSQQKAVLPRLPDTASELKEVAASVQADLADVILGAAATVTRVKQAKLDQYRIVYFATHGCLLATLRILPNLTPSPHWCCPCPSIRQSKTTAFSRPARWRN
jgi:CHAT domain-containing protein